MQQNLDTKEDSENSEKYTKRSREIERFESLRFLKIPANIQKISVRLRKCRKIHHPMFQDEVQLLLTYFI